MSAVDPVLQAPSQTLGRGALLAVAAVVALAGCSEDSAPVDAGTRTDNDANPDGALLDGGAPDGGDVSKGYTWDLPDGFPEPKTPEDSPMSEAKVELGRHLFYDKRLSENQTQSCASCHKQELAFTDGEPVGIGSTGEHHSRSSMSLANVAYTTTLTWANAALTTLEGQALVPLFGEAPVELGFIEPEDFLPRLRKDETYQRLFAEAYPDADEPIDLDGVTKAIGAFQRTLLSGNSGFDRYMQGEPGAMSESAARGMELFFGEEAECFHCHGGFTFSDSETHSGKVFDEVAFHNTGLYNIDGEGAYPEPNRGIYEATGKIRDMGRFKAPTLRNIALTAPYMHDGSIETLEGVIEHYAAAGRTLESGPYAGVGADNPFKSELVNGFDFSDDEKADLIAFLEALTDDDFLTDPRYSDPWTSPESGE